MQHTLRQTLAGFIRRVLPLLIVVSAICGWVAGCGEASKPSIVCSFVENDKDANSEGPGRTLRLPIDTDQTVDFTDMRVHVIYADRTGNQDISFVIIIEITDIASNDLIGSNFWYGKTYGELGESWSTAGFSGQHTIHSHRSSRYLDYSCSVEK